jgi:hypothetical protein
MFGKVLDA